MSWLKDVLTKTIKIAGIEQVSRRALNFVAGDGIEITAEDDDAGKVTHLTIAATGEGSGGDADDITYNNSSSGLDAENVQDAIDEVDERISSVQQLADELDDTCAKIASIAVAANHTITDADYGGLDPALTRLIIYVSAAAEITFPTLPVHGQVVEVVSLGGTSYSVTIVPGGGNQMAQYTNQQTTSSSFVINSSTLRFSVSWRCLDNGTNKRWVALTAPKRTGHTFADGLVVAAANAVICNSSTSTNTTGTELAISEGHVLRRLAGGNLSSGKVTGPLCDFSGLSTYADDTAAGVGGLTAGQLYKTATGALMVKL